VHVVGFIVRKFVTMHGHMNVKLDADCVEHVARRYFAVDQSQDLKPASACCVCPPKISWRAVAGWGSEYR
jgi:hypothetical protein